MAKDLSKAVLLDFYGVLLTDKQRDVMELYYNQDLSLGEIAENAGITRQGVLDSIHRGEGTLQEMEEKLGLYRSYRERVKLLEQIKRAAKEIDNLNESGYHFNSSIRTQTEQIAKAVDALAEREE